MSAIADGNDMWCIFINVACMLLRELQISPTSIALRMAICFVQTLDLLQLPAPESSGNFFPMLTQADSSGKDVRTFGYTNQTTPANLPVDQQIIAPIGVIIGSSGKQPAVQEQINQVRLQSLDKSERKRKAPSSSRASVEKGKAHVAGSALPARTQPGRKGIAFEEIRNLHTTKSEFLCCHFNSQGELLSTAGHDKKPSKPFGNLAGHAGHVMSIDFHPIKLRLLSSCDSNNEIRLWDIRTGDCIINFKGHVEDVRSICWDRTGNCLESVSEYSAWIWYVRDGECIHELNSGDNRFQSCTFHPGHGQVLVIGSDKVCLTQFGYSAKALSS
ncbi:hypothetical protein RND71_026487 [Anisodus tanguticus]|uniref:Uncharacterized protein n=1 Tax=Anisodus tanguticus TaxID=243964 RepID=A0AAE1V2W4_9SOLA|nr:hypothetical protein RND71_026487 [Anisodus tanguticus]